MSKRGSRKKLVDVIKFRRTVNALRRVGITTLGELASLSIHDFYAIKGTGRTGYDQCQETLRAHGLDFRNSFPKDNQNATN